MFVITWEENNLLHKLYTFSRWGNTVVLSAKQLKSQYLEVCFSKKAPEERRPACLLHFSPDWQHTPKEPRRRTRTLIQSDTPDLSRAARLAHRAARPGRLKRPHNGRHCHCHPPPPTLTTISRAGNVKAWDCGETVTQSERLSTTKKGMPSEFGSDIRLLFPIALHRWKKYICKKWIIALIFFLLWPYIISFFLMKALLKPKMIMKMTFA